MWLGVVLGTIILNSFPAANERTAIVCFLEGKATLFDVVAKESRDLQLFDWLGAGAVIEANDAARIVLAFANGDRYELKGKIKATLKMNGFASTSGTPVKLSAVPVMPRIVALAAESKPGSGLSAIRLRGAKRALTGLYPAEGCSAVANETILSFTPLENIEKYRVELEDEWGNRLLAVETDSAEVVVSPGILKPGSRYYWWVVTLDNIKPSTAAEAEFSTLSVEQANFLNAFKKQVEPTKDVTQLLLFSQLESVLNLRKEACATLREAQQLSPENTEIAKALERMSCKPSK